MTLTELDHLNQLLRDRGDYLDAMNHPATADFDDQDAEVLPEVEDLLTQTIADYQEKKRLLLADKIQEIECTLLEKYNLDLTVNPQDSN